MSKPRIYRQSPGRWYIQVSFLPYAVGPFLDWSCAYRYVTLIARGI